MTHTALPTTPQHQSSSQNTKRCTQSSYLSSVARNHITFQFKMHAQSTPRVPLVIAHLSATTWMWRNICVPGFLTNDNSRLRAPRFLKAQRTRAICLVLVLFLLPVRAHTAMGLSENSKKHLKQLDITHAHPEACTKAPAPFLTSGISQRLKRREMMMRRTHTSMVAQRITICSLLCRHGS